jgi:hypothetical protein
VAKERHHKNDRDEQSQPIAQGGQRWRRIRCPESLAVGTVLHALPFGSAQDPAITLVRWHRFSGAGGYSVVL